MHLLPAVIIVLNYLLHGNVLLFEKCCTLVCLLFQLAPLFLSYYCSALNVFYCSLQLFCYQVSDSFIIFHKMFLFILSYAFFKKSIMYISLLLPFSTSSYLYGQEFSALNITKSSFGIGLSNVEPGLRVSGSNIKPRTEQISKLHHS